MKSDVVSDRNLDAKKVHLLVVEKFLVFVKRDASFPAPPVHFASLESSWEMWVSQHHIQWHHHNRSGIKTIGKSQKFAS